MPARERSLWVWGLPFCQPLPREGATRREHRLGAHASDRLRAIARTTVDVALDGSGFPSGTYSEFQPSGIRTKAAQGTVSVANFDLTVAVVKRRSWTSCRRPRRLCSNMSAFIF